MKIITAGIPELDSIALLFDAYRQFYSQNSELELSRLFIRERLVNKESVIFLALLDDKPAGFVQLYPSFSSVSMKKMWHLNDLFVEPQMRQKGVARALLKQVECFAKETNALTVKLATAVSNDNAKALYESEGYIKVKEFDHYTQRVK